MSTKEPARTANRHRSAKDTVRQFNKRVLNPVMLLLAGRKHWYASALEHVGRRSGRRYTTPVVAGRTPDGGFIVPLPYGTEVDWLRNVLAEGTATLRSRGVTYHVTDPRVVDADAAFTQVAPKYAQAWCRFGITRYLKLSIGREH
ncbi:nitroreductase family deazaflavin-dependent oxidoreductase [Amycolatopsis sp. NPDC021455]|uniref:nitroreductase family deazaflavin-dependent oxidoreductase n=1 Tax=Amycolatopsis sp. NPDC021455 TaxID=3154901 RepID=UPI0033C7D736